MAHVYMVYVKMYDNLTEDVDTILIGLSEDKKKANDLGRIVASKAGIPLPDGDCDISSLSKIPLQGYWDDREQYHYRYIKDGNRDSEIECYAYFHIEEYELDRCFDFDMWL